MTALTCAADLRARGFAVVGRLVAREDLPELRAAAERALVGVASSDYGWIRHDPWRVEPALERALRAPAVAALARALGAPRLFQDHVISKPPGAEAEVAWHQDHAYWPLASPRGATLWVALDDVDEDNGCLRYLPGTHLLGERRAADFTRGAAQPARDDLPPLDAAARAHEAVAVPLAAGEAVVHDPLVWHMSPPNRSDRPRRAWSITLVGEDACWDPAHAPHPYVWSLSPGPGEPLDPARFPRLG